MHFISELFISIELVLVKNNLSVKFIALFLSFVDFISDFELISMTFVYDSMKEFI